MNTGYDLSPSQKEQARHGERMFPLKRYVTVLSDLCPSVPAHWHEEAELTMITKGSCIYHIHLETYEAQACSSRRPNCIRSPLIQKLR